MAFDRNQIPNAQNHERRFRLIARIEQRRIHSVVNHGSTDVRGMDYLLPYLFANTNYGSGEFINTLRNRGAPFADPRTSLVSGIRVQSVDRDHKRNTEFVAQRQSSGPTRQSGVRMNQIERLVIVQVTNLSNQTSSEKLP